MHHLKLPEVCDADGVVLRAHIQKVWNAVVVKIIFAGVTSSIPCGRKLEKFIISVSRSVKYAIHTSKDF